MVVKEFQDGGRVRHFENKRTEYKFTCVCLCVCVCPLHFLSTRLQVRQATDFYSSLLKSSGLAMAGLAGSMNPGPRPLGTPTTTVINYRCRRGPLP